MSTDNIEVDVAIVGGGPVGLGLAIELAQRGISVRVFERCETLHRIPRGQNLTQRTGEHFRVWQITEAVRATTPIPREFGNAGVVLYKNLLSAYHYDWFQRSRVGAYYFAQNERLPQYLLEQVLRERAQSLANLQLDLGVTVNSVQQYTDRVQLTFDGGNGKSSGTCLARYVVGCDGARSLVREQAGIEQSSDHQGPKMALLVFRSLQLDKLLERYPGKSIYNVMNPDLNGYWQFLGRVDLQGGWFYHAPVPDTATVDNYDFKAHLHQFAGTAFELSFEHIGFWHLRISRAKTYRSGRVFIAGDAAHSHPPYGGYGVNTGFEDARNLGWKLEAQLKGWAGEGLLDSYSAERLPVFRSVSRDFIERMISDFQSFLSNYSPEQDLAAFTEAWQKRAAADDSDVTEFLPNYRGSSLHYGASEGEPSARGIHTFAAEAGYHLAPQELPDRQDLWEALGDGFTLIDLVGDKSVCALFEQAAEKIQVPLKILGAPSKTLQKNYAARYLLVRPDQFIAWVGDTDDVDASAILSCAVGHGV